jgi:hypothetical protein
MLGSLSLLALAAIVVGFQWQEREQQLQRGSNVWLGHYISGQGAFLTCRDSLISIEPGDRISNAQERCPRRRHILQMQLVGRITSVDQADSVLSFRTNDSVVSVNVVQATSAQFTQLAPGDSISVQGVLLRDSALATRIDEIKPPGNR